MSDNGSVNKYDTTSVCSSPTMRDGHSAGVGRGGRGGGGFVPKKRLQEKMNQLELNPIEKDDHPQEEKEMDMEMESGKKMEEQQEDNKPDDTDENKKLKDDNISNKFQLPMMDLKNKHTGDNSDKSSHSDSSDSSGFGENPKKRCDFCLNPDHLSRNCPVLIQGRGNIPALMPEQRGPIRGNFSGKPVECYYCHEQGHIKADCPKRVNTNCCFYCHKEGHVIADCPDKVRRAAKKPEDRITLNYAFRKSQNKSGRFNSNPSTPIPEKSAPVPTFYEGPSKDDDDEEVKKEGDEVKAPRVIVPFPVKPSEIIPQVQLRSKLVSSESEMSQHKIIRSESSEEEEMDSFDEDEDLGSKKDTIAKQNDGQKGEQGDEEEMQTETVVVDGCIEFDSDDDERNYQDCSEGEGQEEDRKRPIVEEDDHYGEDGALLCEDGPNGDVKLEEEGMGTEQEVKMPLPEEVIGKGEERNAN